MRDGRPRILSAVIALLLPSSLFAAPPVSAGDVLEKGFRVHSTSCFEITQPQGLGYIVKHAACSPGGSWGPYLYVSLADAFDLFGPGVVARIDSRGRISSSGLGGRVPGHFDFSSAGGPWGDRLWLDTANVLGTAPSIMGGCSSDVTNCDFTCADPGYFVFDRSGAFDHALYTRILQGTVQTVRLTDPHNCTLIDPDVIPHPDYEFFSAAPAAPVAFGPGGAWGTSLYAMPGTIIQPDGSYVTFGFPFGYVTWAADSSSPAWAGDMFARLSGGNAGDVYRVKPDGTSTLFATDLPGEMAFCNDGLWFVRNGACTKITATGPK